MTRRRNLALALGVIMLLIVAGTVSAGQVEEAFNRTVPASPGDRVVVDNENGSVTIDAWDRNEVRIEATKYADDSESLAKIKIEVTNEGGVVGVRTVTPRRSESHGFWGWLTGDNGNMGVTYRVTVPRSSNLDIDTINGRVVVHEVSGQMDLESTNGRIEVHDASGRVDASTTNGRIYAQLRSVSGGGMRFSTTNGSVELELPDSVGANLDVSTTNGSIKTEFPITVSGSFNKNRLSGAVNGGGESIRVRTTNGSVRINKNSG